MGEARAAVKLRTVKNQNKDVKCADTLTEPPHVPVTSLTPVQYTQPLDRKNID